MSQNSTPSRTPNGLRAGLLAGACAIAIVGAGASQNVFFAPTAANAQSVSADRPIATIAAPSFADLVEKVRPAVVSVKVKIENASMDDDGIAEGRGRGGMPGFDDLPEDHPMKKFFKQFGGGEGRPEFGPRGGERRSKQFGQSQGSGFFVTQDGYVVTNNHVVSNAVEVTVKLEDGRTLDATVVGRDPRTDLAVLKVKQDGSYPFVRLAGTPPRVGDWVVAVGNPFGLGGTVTAGIVSARGRDIGAGPYDDFLQIDAPVNRGNSGGPTFNANGEVVGVNTAIFSPSGGNVGIAFAIPADTVNTVVASLKETGTVARGYIGVQIQPITAEIADSIGLKDTKGALVSEAQKDGPAVEAGIKAGDAITQVNGDMVASPKELSKRIGAMKPGETAKLTVIRDGKEKTVSLKLGNLPGDKTAKADTGVDAAPATFGLQLAPAGKDGADTDGVVITKVDPDGLGAEQGLKQGDVILEIAGKAVSEPSQVKASLEQARKDGKKAVLMRIKSGDNSRFVALAFPKKG
jgi:serine protease Do